MTEMVAKFALGSVVHHRLFDYRGVVVDVDAKFSHSDEWYEVMARSQPRKDRPWYHVLKDGTDIRTYVAEQNLDADTTGRPIVHPEVGVFFSRFDTGRYVSNRELT